MQYVKVELYAPIARRMPDPVFAESRGIERHILFVPVRQVPRDIPTDPNPRDEQNLRRQVYRTVEESLLDEGEGVEPGTFHLKHKGITIVASQVKKAGEDRYVLYLEEGKHGILDGGHTYKLIERNLDNGQLPERQFVKFEVLTSLPGEWIPAIGGGLNTSVQVQDMSLDDLAGKFDWLKEMLENEPYAPQIAWRENHSDAEVDARELLAILDCFNVAVCPNNGDKHPVRAYEKNSLVLKYYDREDGDAEFQRMRPIIKDILVLHDRIRKDARALWNAQGGHAGGLKFVEEHPRGWTFPFIQERDTHRLTKGALMPMLAAFRWFVEKDSKSGAYRWKRNFSYVQSQWSQVAAELMRMTIETSKDQGRSPDAIGKSRPHWKALHTTVALRDLQQGALAR